MNQTGCRLFFLQFVLCGNLILSISFFSSSVLVAAALNLLPDGSNSSFWVGWHISSNCVEETQLLDLEVTLKTVPVFSLSQKLRILYSYDQGEWRTV